MRRQRIIILLFLAVALTSCSPGHLGGTEIAFVRDGHLWTIEPDGANAFEVAAMSGGTVKYSLGSVLNHVLMH